MTDDATKTKAGGSPRLSEELGPVETLAHRMAWRYRKSSDPHHSDTYTFNRAKLLEFAETLKAHERERCAKLCEGRTKYWQRDDIRRYEDECCAAAIRGA